MTGRVMIDNSVTLQWLHLPELIKELNKCKFVLDSACAQPSPQDILGFHYPEPPPY